MSIIELTKVTKKFGQKTILDSVDLTIEEGRIYGLLGRNASGKTSLMKLLTTRYLPSEGLIRILGEDPLENDQVLSDICFMSDNMPAFLGKRIANLLKMASVCYKNWDQEYAKYLLELFDINPKEYYTDKLSKGQKTSVAIIIGLASRCQVTMLDEIYSGLDAVIRKRFYELLLEDYSEHPRTFILSTHLIDEMSNLFSDVIILDKGNVLVNEEVEELREKAYQIEGASEAFKTMPVKKVIHESSFGGQLSKVIFDTVSSDEIADMKRLGLDVKKMALQDIFIEMTSISEV